MSWQSALKDAAAALDRLQLKNEDIAGKQLDLEQLFMGHPSVGRYRIMIYQAADRLLAKRGATTNLRTFDIKKRRSHEEQ